MLKHMRTRLTPPVFDRDDYYESSSRMIRWVCLGLVLVSYPPDQANSLIVFTVILASAVYNLLRYHPRINRLPIFSSRINSLGIDHIFVLSLVFVSGGLASPYYPLFFLLIIAVIASYGVSGFALTLAGQVLITLLLLQVKSPPLPATPEYQLIIKLVFLILFSLVAEQSVRSRDEEYLLETRFTKRIENERQRLLSLINSLSSAVLAVDQSGKVYLYNAAALELLNTNRDITGEPLRHLLPLHDEKYTSIDIFEIAKKDDRVVSRQDLVFVPNDGSEMVLDLTVSPVHVLGFGQGQESWGGYMVVFRDITKQKSLEEERNEFISVTSHELRTPLAIAEANLSTALLPGFAKIDPKAVNILNQAHENIIFLSELIQDLTTLSRAERGDLKIQRTLVDPNQLAEEVARDYRAQATAKGLTLKLETDPEAKKVETSEHEMREIMQNFLTNAIKYTVKGTVTLRVEHHRDAAVIVVKDTGIGISATDKNKVFDKFYRSEDYRTRATGGTGLGLYITKKLAERLGLDITFTSRLNRGSSFAISIPYHIPAESLGKVVKAAQTS
jgi:two-component system phosphate regulon sensor histidine kinase PhoR